MNTLFELTWPRDELAAAIVSLTIQVGYSTTSARPLPPISLPNWLDEAARSLGVEFEQGNVPDTELPLALREIGPGILQIGGRLLVVAKSSSSTIELLLPNGTRKIGFRKLLQILRTVSSEMPETPAILANVPRGAELYRKTVEALAEESAYVAVSISMRVAATRSLSDELASLRLRRRLLALASLLVATDFVSLGSTLVLTDLSMTGRLDGARIVGWGIGALLVTAIQGVISYRLGRLNIELSATVKRRLIEGTFRYDLDQARVEGYGTVLSRAAQAGMLDSLSIADPIQLLHGVAMIIVAGALLATLKTALLLAFLVAVLLSAVLLGLRLAAAANVFDDQIALSDVYIDRILGHRTRVVQLPRSLWHVGEDEPLFAYFTSVKRADLIGIVTATLPRIWLFAGVALVLAQFIADSRTDQVVLALAGVALGQQALQGLAAAAGRVSLWYNSLRKLAKFLRFAEAPEPETHHFRNVAPLGDGQPVLLAKGLRFSYGADRPPILRGADLTFAAGDRVLVTGPSGGGKSTLAALLTGLRQPTAGIVLLRGLDQHSVNGSAWRRRIVSVPQFQENHIFQETLLFNLLMGGTWPATPEARQRAAILCDELGLGPLLDRMPSGLDQLLGESGWQLSHGERSRVFMARALLQEADLVIFDESFGTLDPETLQIAMKVAKRHARTLMVIAHT